MSRHSYSDDYDEWALIRWRGAVASAIRGARGQALLKEMLAALDAMPDKRLVKSVLEDEDGEVCALGCLGRARGLDLSELDPEDYSSLAPAFGVAESLIREIEYINDDHREYDTRTSLWKDVTTPESRWREVREWVASQIKDGGQR